ncbi:transposase [Pseudomonas sp. HD6421]|uniref:RNA-guided endonuclease InsQ/TnpB family protein n=1 Tax=Pseudomonas sp. HD6421 TaxID=2860319 RepID=UPI0021BB0C9B|nr:transposase [Pseudomonas sp. HD6421]
MKATKTLQLRIKDRHAPVLRAWARSVNTVWNYLNELSYRNIRDHGRFLTGFDFQPYTKGSGKLLGLHSGTVQELQEQYAVKRNAAKRARLAWRKSGGVRRSLGWVPFKGAQCAPVWKNGQLYFNGHYFGVWDSYGLGQFKFRAGSFSEDARGRWYFNVCVEVERTCPAGQAEIGIDLGLNTTATCSDGSALEAGRFYRDLEGKLAIAQRAGKKTRARAIHAKIANRRKDALHKFSTALVQRCGLIVVGNVKPKALAKTQMAKSVHDAGWGMLKTMLSYKCDSAGIVFREVNEAYTTQACSHCGALPPSSPKGRTGLGIREWTCECGVTHDRDINAARNILAVGHGRLPVGIPVL